ncbi:hypothetical protein C9374_007633 [Naegleria lovaniensis]|uniref:Uncharacterized protein n=1 Tax=Naegleria lovaniensis TaxID=51637 RepID=A0AA88GLJ7_NAELO|nr:uncharacterized protein C9374_007633 [Naegleria lovaniensis]KAG2378995.1 hypothetical protein C9374_007633 [Naegleria lovaniensis]
MPEALMTAAAVSLHARTSSLVREDSNQEESCSSCGTTAHSQQTLSSSSLSSNLQCIISSQDSELVTHELSTATASSSCCIVTECSLNSTTTSANSSMDNATQFLALTSGSTLSEDSQRILCVPNAGGNSVFSEVLSFEFIKMLIESLCASIRVSLHKTEMELVYKEGSKITDMCIALNNTMTNETTLMGCSVTRCFNFMNLEEVVSDVSIKLLLKKKLSGIIDSTNGVIGDQWTRQILHIWTSNMQTAQSIKRIYETEISDELKSNTIVIITCTCGGMECIFKEKGDDAKMVMKLLGFNVSEDVVDEEVSAATEDVDDDIDNFDVFLGSITM